jgi:hypothetical protein
VSGVGDEQLLALPYPLAEFLLEILSRRRLSEYILVDHIADDVFQRPELPLQVATSDRLPVVPPNGVSAVMRYFIFRSAAPQ